MGLGTRSQASWRRQPLPWGWPGMPPCGAGPGDAHPPRPCFLQCSAPCGGGVQRRLVKCVNTQTGLPEEDSDLCGHEAWPESSRPCGTQDCELTEPPRECPTWLSAGAGDRVNSGEMGLMKLSPQSTG